MMSSHPANCNCAVRNLIFLILLLVPVLSFASEWAPDYPVGSKLPPFEAPDQMGVLWTNKRIMGQNGAVFFFNRSTSW